MCDMDNGEDSDLSYELWWFTVSSLAHCCSTKSYNSKESSITSRSRCEIPPLSVSRCTHMGAFAVAVLIPHAASGLAPPRPGYAIWPRLPRGVITRYCGRSYGKNFVYSGRIREAWQ